MSRVHQSGKISAIHGSVVYFLYKENELIYIGSTKNLYQRLGAHISNGRIFDQYTFESCPEEMRLTLEAHEILKFKPLENQSLPKNSFFVSQTQAKVSFGMRANEFKAYWKESEKIIFNANLYLDFRKLPKEDQEKWGIDL